MSALHDALLAAHEAEDLVALARLYGEAADDAEARSDIEAARFFLTQAYVYALEAGAAEAGVLNRRLAGHGADELQDDLM